MEHYLLARPDLYGDETELPPIVLENGKITISGSSEGEMRALLKSGQDITVHGADVKVGQTARSFTAGELQDPVALNAAVQLLKGEV